MSTNIAPTTTPEPPRSPEWGLRGVLPTNAVTAWGARAILQTSGDFPIDLLPDRQDIIGEPEQRSLLKHLLNAAGGTRIMQARVKSMLNARVIDSRKASQVTLLDTDLIRVDANTNASHGYLYLTGWLKPEATNMEGALWTGKEAPPVPGDSVLTCVHKRGKELVKVLTPLNLNGNYFLVFVDPKAKVDARNLRDLRAGQYLDTPGVPHLALGLTVGRELC
jgi:hypothetical protein